MLDDLRQRVAALERPPAFPEDAPAVAFGIPVIDRVIGGGLSRGALHEVAALGEAHLPAATGFTAGLARAAHASTDGAIVWLAEDMSLAETGAVYGPGLLDFGVPPAKLLTVAVVHRRDLLWAMEEALRWRSVALVVGEMRAGALDGVAVRRLSLAAVESGALALLLRAAPPDDASTAATRWLVGAAPASPSRAGRGEEERTSRGQADQGIAAQVHFTAHLIRNRRGPLGSWILTWSEENGFAAHAQPLAAPAADRPHRAVA